MKQSRRQQTHQPSSKHLVGDAGAATDVAQPAVEEAEPVPSNFHNLVTCLDTDAEAILNDRLVDSDLVTMCAYQKGTGFGATIQVMMVFRPKETAVAAV